jgi:hypothetical protein
VILARHFKFKPALLTILYMPAILGLTILAAVAMRWSLADIYATQLNHHLATVNRSSSNKNAEQWRLARQHLDHALALRPANAHYFGLAERFYRKLNGLESYRNPLIQELAWSENEPKALDYARRGLRLEPSWPYFWQRLAIGKLALNQLDSELTGAIERAVYLGPWERSVQYSMAIEGLSYWPILEDMARLHVLQAMEQTLAMEKIKHSQIIDIKKILSHINFKRACEKLAKGKTDRQLFPHCGFE